MTGIRPKNDRWLFLKHDIFVKWKSGESDTHGRICGTNRGVPPLAFPISNSDLRLARRSIQLKGQLLFVSMLFLSLLAMYWFLLRFFFYSIIHTQMCGYERVRDFKDSRLRAPGMVENRICSFWRSFHLVSKMVLSSFVTKSIKILSKERSAFAADAERTPLYRSNSKHDWIE